MMSSGPTTRERPLTFAQRRTEANKELMVFQGDPPTRTALQRICQNPDWSLSPEDAAVLWRNREKIRQAILSMSEGVRVIILRKLDFLAQGRQRQVEESELLAAEERVERANLPNQLPFAPLELLEAILLLQPSWIYTKDKAGAWNIQVAVPSSHAIRDQAAALLRLLPARAIMVGLEKTKLQPVAIFFLTLRNPLDVKTLFPADSPFAIGNGAVDANGQRKMEGDGLETAACVGSSLISFMSRPGRRTDKEHIAFTQTALKRVSNLGLPDCAPFVELERLFQEYGVEHSMQEVKQAAHTDVSLCEFLALAERQICLSTRSVYQSLRTTLPLPAATNSVSFGLEDAHHLREHFAGIWETVFSLHVLGRYLLRGRSAGSAIAVSLTTVVQGAIEGWMIDYLQARFPSLFQSPSATHPKEREAERSKRDALLEDIIRALFQWSQELQQMNVFPKCLPDLRDLMRGHLHLCGEDLLRLRNLVRFADDPADSAEGHDHQLCRETMDGPSPLALSTSIQIQTQKERVQRNVQIASFHPGRFPTTLATHAHMSHGTLDGAQVWILPDGEPTYAQNVLLPLHLLFGEDAPVTQAGRTLSRRTTQLMRAIKKAEEEKLQGYRPLFDEGDALSFVQIQSDRPGHARTAAGFLLSPDLAQSLYTSARSEETSSWATETIRCLEQFQLHKAGEKMLSVMDAGERNPVESDRRNAQEIQDKLHYYVSRRHVWEWNDAWDLLAIFDIRYRRKQGNELHSRVFGPHGKQMTFPPAAERERKIRPSTVFDIINHFGVAAEVVRHFEETEYRRDREGKESAPREKLIAS